MLFLRVWGETWRGTEGSLGAEAPLCLLKLSWAGVLQVEICTGLEEAVWQSSGKLKKIEKVVRLSRGINNKIK